MNSKYISVIEYAKKHKLKLLNVYRWIREGKFNDEEVRREKVEMERLRILEDAKPKLNK